MFFLVFLLLLFHSAQEAYCLQDTVTAQPPTVTTTVHFPNFKTVDNNTDLLLLGDAGYSSGALQITPDTINQKDYLINKTGRVFLNRPFRLWESAGNRTQVGTFNTSFYINIFRPNGTIPGEGFAFVLISNPEAPPPGADHGFLGLTNASLDGNPNNHFVAVELDTFKEDYDINDNHVGLDINSVVNSTVTANLTRFGIEIAPVNATNYTVWVDYDGAARHIWVYMIKDKGPKPLAPVLQAPLDLSTHLMQDSYFGFSASTGDEYQLNCVLMWNLTVQDFSRGDDGADLRGWKLGLTVGLPAAAALVGGILLGMWIKRRRKTRDGSSMEMADRLRSLPWMPREFDYKELRKATSNFDEKLKLGQGGFGVVYRGLLPGELNPEVAVKRFSRANGGQEDFLKELTIINRLRHKNLVPLVGWCHTNGVLLLVYVYMPNGSLDQHLFAGINRAMLSWERRYNIISGVASALHYLHNEYDQRVVHRDLKASNVMLDASFNARLGDFGLARALDTDKTSYAEQEMAGVPGTMGYIAPECFHTGKATRESDVFAFGAVVLETVCGRRPRCDIEGFQFLCDWVWKLHREGRIVDAVDPRLAGEYDSSDAERLLLLGLACSLPIPGERPKTQDIVQIISRTVAPPNVPPFKPKFMWPVGPALDEEEESRTSSSQLSGSTVTSSYYASSRGWTPQFLSREDPVGAGGHSKDNVDGAV